jgi:hypothetical protein
MSKLRAPVLVCERAALLADAIETELHTLGMWDERPPALAAPASFFQRLEFELLPLLRGLGEAGIEGPEQTSIGTRGAVELANRPDAVQLEQLLFEVDRLIRGCRIELARIAGLPKRRGRVGAPH